MRRARVAEAAALAAAVALAAALAAGSARIAGPPAGADPPRAAHATATVRGGSFAHLNSRAGLSLGATYHRSP